MKIEYDSNNSGGHWWIEDEHWHALVDAGWEVKWFKDSPVGMIKPDEDGRWLRALAMKAFKDFETPAEAMREFEKVTKQDVCDEGCNCCGPPHSFRWDGGYASGDGCLEHLFPGKRPQTLREALEQQP